MIHRRIVPLAILVAFGTAEAANTKDVSLAEIGRFETGVFDEGAAEIVAYDAVGQTVFVINADARTVDLLNISDPTSPSLAGFIDVSSDLPDSGGVNSVAVHDGLVAVAVENDDKQANGWAAFYDTAGNFIAAVPAGPLPDAIAMTPNGQYALVANEGEPSDDYTNDPEGSITVIDLRDGAANATAATAGFTAFNGGAPAGVRISGPGASVAQDLEPEFIAISHDSKTAWVSLQENNAVAVVDIRSATVTGLVGLGNKDHSLPGNGLDASNEDGAINIRNWPVLGTFMPDTIAAFRVKGQTYLVTANEGDGREYFFDIEPEDLLPEETEADACTRLGGLDYDDDDGCLSWIDETRVKDVALDPSFTAADPDIQDEDQLGRLKMLTTEGNLDGDEEYEEIHVFGARSITIWSADGTLLADTGDTMEQITALTLPDDFNSTNDENGSFDDRSDDKGPEPEGVVVGKVRGRQYAFVGLERVGGIMTFDVSIPSEPRFVDYVNNRDFSADNDAVENGMAGDLGPEGLVFINEEDSPNGQPLLVVGNEVSGTTTIYQVNAD